jgi:tetratricopeptide (TPR) repeat protein
MAKKKTLRQKKKEPPPAPSARRRALVLAAVLMAAAIAGGWLWMSSQSSDQTGHDKGDAVAATRTFKQQSDEDLTNRSRGSLAPSGTAITLRARVPLPTIEYQDFQGQLSSLDDHLGKPVLVNLWTNWSDLRKQQLQELARHQAKIESARLQVVTLFVDGTDGDKWSTKAVRDWVEESEFPFVSAVTAAEVPDQLKILNNELFDQSQALPLPTSYLLDAGGNLAVMYQGPVTVARLLWDLEQLDHRDGPLTASATPPFADRWRAPSGRANFTGLANVLLEKGYAPAAKQLATRNRALLAQQSRFPTLLDQLADNQLKPDDLAKAQRLVQSEVDQDPKNTYSMKVLGVVCARQNRLEEAVRHLKAALEFDTFDVDAHHEAGMALENLGHFEEAMSHFLCVVALDPKLVMGQMNLAAALLRNGDLDRAISHYNQAIRLDPQNTDAHHHIGVAYVAKGHVEAAVEHYRKALELDPQRPFLTNNLAWILATHPDAKLRNGAEATRLAERGVKAKQQPDAGELDTLAAAYAEAGRFQEAVQTAQAALKQAQAGGQFELAKHITSHLVLFENDKPFRESQQADVAGGPQPGTPETEAFIERVRPKVTAFCGNCHATPWPDSFPQHEWKKEVDQGYKLYEESERQDLELPPFAEVLAFFTLQAPVELELDTTIAGSAPTKLPLHMTTLNSASENEKESTLEFASPPAVSHVNWIELGLSKGRALIYCDMQSGVISAAWPGQADSPTQQLATLRHPAHVEPCDLDADGHVDLIVADLGSFLPADHEAGRVVWLRRRGETDEFEVRVLQDRIGRVADVRPGDFDGDGNLDLIVAEFGWRKTGRIFLLKNEGITPDGLPRFSMHVIDGRSGAINVPPVDFNGDGLLDFVALISQEHESIEVFLNTGDGVFENKMLWKAQRPSYGSSGIQLVDLDQDGDVDILYANGDSFDSFLPKPYHSVQWLENDGGYAFVHHHLTSMPGVHAARAGDFDQDGDLDVVATAFLPPQVNERLRLVDVESVVVLEQSSPGNFVRSKVEANSCTHPTLAVGDFDANGYLDFATGNFLTKGDNSRTDVNVWWNGLEK